jgi:hypothetical protein
MGVTWKWRSRPGARGDSQRRGSAAPPRLGGDPLDCAGTTALWLHRRGTFGVGVAGYGGGKAGSCPPQSKGEGAELTWRGLPALARIQWHRLKFKVPFNPEVFAQAEARQKRKKLARLQDSAAALGLTLVPAQ